MTSQRPARCLDIFRGDRCARPLGHPEPHRNGEHTWTFRDVPVPEWRRLATFRRDLTGVGS